MSPQLATKGRSELRRELELAAAAAAAAAAAVATAVAQTNANVSVEVRRGGHGERPRRHVAVARRLRRARRHTLARFAPTAASLDLADGVDFVRPFGVVLAGAKLRHRRSVFCRVLPFVSVKAENPQKNTNVSHTHTPPPPPFACVRARLFRPSMSNSAGWRMTGA